MPLIKCENLHLHYDKTPVVHNVSFEVEEGDCVSIVGENGTGKSTLVKGILGLIKNADGKVIFDGISKNEIGYLPQQTSVQKDFPASVYEVVMSAFQNKSFPFYKKSQKQLADENIKLLGIENIRKKSYMDLSGGQQQRVLLARALCATKKLLILDEPITGLDPVVTAEFYELISELHKEKGLTILMVSHDVKRAVESSDKILHMDKKVLFFGKTEDYIKTEYFNKMTGGNENA